MPRAVNMSPGPIVSKLGSLEHWLSWKSLYAQKEARGAALEVALQKLMP